MHNTESTIGLGFSREYMIHELIFINSGSNYYVRLPVDQHAALISDNNSGKTSSLSALKLFLLPETTFKKQKDKFGFQSGGTYYEDLSSYHYYFPDPESYIICNASNSKGSFSWVLFRTTKYEYHRIAVPHNYDSIEYLFWNANADMNEGCGALHLNIKPSHIKKVLLSQYQGKLFNERKDIGEAIYTRASDSNDNTRFCLLPMAKGYSSSKTETVRALLGMAFSLGHASTTSLPQAIGAILDGSVTSALKTNSGEGILINLDAQQEEWRELKGEYNRLGKVEAQMETFHQLSENRTEYFKLKGLFSDQYKSLVWSTTLMRNKLTDSVEVLRKNVNDSENALKHALRTFDAEKTNYTTAKSKLESQQRYLKETIESLVDVDACRSYLGPLCPDSDRSDKALLSIIEGQISECQTDIETLNNENSAVKRLETLNRQIQSNKRQAEFLRQSITHHKSKKILLDSLSQKSAEILVSINESFGEVPVEPSLEQINTIETFTNLFDITSGSLSFCDTPLHKITAKNYSKEGSLRNLEEQLEVVLTSIERDSEKLLEIDKLSKKTAEQRNESLKEYTEELAKLEHQKKAINGAGVLEEQRERQSDYLNELQVQHDQQFEKFEIAKERKASLTTQYNTAKTNLDGAQEPLKQIQNVSSELRSLDNNSKRRILSYEHIEQEYREEDAVERSVEELIQMTSDVSGLLQTVNNRREDTLKDMDRLLMHGIIDCSPEDRHSVTTSSRFFEEMFGSLQAVFLNLDYAKEKYKATLSHHNNTTAAAAQAIGNVHSLIQNFIDGINSDIHGYKISNLTSVSLIADLHKQYVDMTKTLSRMSNRTDQLMDEEFYLQIGNFRETFYNKKTHKVEISKIIERVHYKFERNNSFEDTPQSNGTNCMINSVLLALFFKRLVPEDLRLSMPVVFDEVGSLDEKNFHEILKVMTEYDLFLFVANPEMNGVIASVLDVYHNLSLFKATDSEVFSKAEAIYFPSMSERLVTTDELVTTIKEHNHESVVEAGE